MGAGIMQLMFFGQQDIYLKSNPSITFFKKVYKTHTNFAMEPISVTLNRMDTNIYEKTILKVKIPRHGDLLHQVYITLELPEIISNSSYQFKWTENMGETIIENCYITVGGTLVDRHYGEYMHILNNITLSTDKRSCYDQMIGNIQRNTNPELYWESILNLSTPPIRYRIGSGYPTSIPYDPLQPSTYRPSIPTMRLYIPLMFWFNRALENALPLIALQYSEVELTLELRPWNELYKLFYTKNNIPDHYAPDLSIPQHHLKNFISNTRRTFLVNDATIDSRIQIDCNYIYLDDKERKYFTEKPLEYLIDQVYKVDFFDVRDISIIDLKLQNPVKELIWVIKRSDLNNWNDWFRFIDDRQTIMKTAKLIFNGIDRTEEKPGEYFNYVQTFQHHTGNPREGVYLYSFSLKPEDLSQPSGSCNMSRINNVQLHVTSKEPFGQYQYNLSLYSISHNFLRIASGLAGVVFST